jgi:hypothetical protein
LKLFSQSNNAAGPKGLKFTKNLKDCTNKINSIHTVTLAEKLNSYSTKDTFLITIKINRMQTINSRPVYKIAEEILNDWQAPYFGARPYLAAMLTINNELENYGQDTAKSIILYFLSNASTYRGSKAKELKKELKTLIK